MDEYCEDCEAPFDYCVCGEEPEDYPDPHELYEWHAERDMLEESGPDYWQNDAGEWRLG